MRYYFIIIASLIIGAIQAQKIDLGRSVLINDDTEKSLFFINAQQEADKIVSEILFAAGFQFFVDKSDSLLIVYGLSIPSPFAGEKYELEANLEFYKYDDNSCVAIKSYKTRFFTDSNNKLQSKVTADGFLQIMHNGQHVFDVIATAKWFCNCSLSLRPADCVVKPRRCAASPAFYALSAELMKTDHFTKPLRGGYKLKTLSEEEFKLMHNFY